MRMPISVLTTLLLTSACTTAYSPPTVSGAVPVVGIAQVLSTAAIDTVDVLFIHGMCTTPKDWVVATNQNLLKALGSSETVSPLPPAAVFEGQTQLYEEAFTVSGKTLRTHAILWSPVTVPIKQALCYDETKKSDVCLGTAEYSYRRVLANQWLKDHLMNDCLADAIIYAGNARETIQRQVKDAILFALGNGSSNKTIGKQIATATIEDAPLFFVSQSLGSKVIFDTLNGMRANPDLEPVVQQTFKRAVEVFMEANQLPILALGTSTLGAPARETLSDAENQSRAARHIIFEDSLNELVWAYKDKRMAWGTRIFGKGNEPMFKVIALTDPNDLLSYFLRGSAAERDAKYDIVDVAVSNAPSWVWVVESPWAAHTGHPSNPDVQRILACGYPVWTGCQPNP